jgi:hypothetical protein
MTETLRGLRPSRNRMTAKAVSDHKSPPNDVSTPAVANSVYKLICWVNPHVTLLDAIDKYLRIELPMAGRNHEQTQGPRLQAFQPRVDGCSKQEGRIPQIVSVDGTADNHRHRQETKRSGQDPPCQAVRLCVVQG